MRLLNLCCGATRPGEPWTNLDLLYPVLKPGTPERANLDAETNYVEHDVLSGPLPFEDETFDGILASHCVEHWDCQESVRVLKECRRVLKKQGKLFVSVPNARYFLEHISSDTAENAEKLFGEPIHPEDGETTFFGYGLFNRLHKQILTYDSVACLLMRAGFKSPLSNLVFPYFDPKVDEEFFEMLPIVNRRKFSAEMVVMK